MYTKWTTKEDRLLRRAIDKNPQNISQAIKDILPKLNDRTFNSAVYHYYYRVNNPDSPAYIKPQFALVSYCKKFYSKNNSTKNKSLKIKRSLWSTLKQILFS